jgi:hypothetical protein
MRRTLLLTAGVTAALALPASASAEPLTLAGVFAYAAPLVKLVIIALVLATAAAPIVAILKLAAARRLAGGSAFLSGLRLGGPLTGLVGAAYGGLNMALGVANVAGPVPPQILARGVAEIMALILLGLISGSVAVVANWAVEARIDRSVLAPELA